LAPTFGTLVFCTGNVQIDNLVSQQSAKVEYCMTSQTTAVPPIKISAQMRQEFKNHAPAALARRNNAYMLGIAVNVGQWLLIGSLGLLGLYHWQWTPSEMLLVFVSGIVASIIADGLKYVFARQKMLAEYATMEKDRLVWAMFEASRREVDEIAAARLQQKRPGTALLMDIALGAVGLWFLSTQLATFGLNAAVWGELSGGVRLALIVVCAAPVLAMLSAAIAHRNNEGGYDDLEFRAGGRGIGLILFAIALAFFGEGDAAARSMMLFVNWATVIAGLLSVAGVAVIVGERNKLREHLAASVSKTRPG